MAFSEQPITGVYDIYINGVHVERVTNLIPTEGANYLLNAALDDSVSRISDWYLALYGNNVSPAATWTGAAFVSTAGEIVSQTEGYTGANRPKWENAVATGGIMDNTATKATFVIATASSVNVAGVALLSTPTRGAAGTLLSATRFSTARTLYNGDELAIAYTVQLSSTS